MQCFTPRVLVHTGLLWHAQLDSRPTVPQVNIIFDCGCAWRFLGQVQHAIDDLDDTQRLPNFVSSCGNACTA